MFKKLCLVNFCSEVHFLAKVGMKAYVFAVSGTKPVLKVTRRAAEVEHHDVRLTEGAIIHGTKASRAPSTENMAALVPYRAPCCVRRVESLKGTP